MSIPTTASDDASETKRREAKRRRAERLEIGRREAKRRKAEGKTEPAVAEPPSKPLRQWVRFSDPGERSGRP